MSKTRDRKSVPLVAALLLMAICRHATAQLVANGGFEANGGAGTTILTDWSAADQLGSAGGFYAQTGGGTPLFGNTVPAPPEGQYAAMTDAGGAGAHVLYQDFVVPTGVGNATLSFQVFVNNQASDFTTSSTLDYTGTPNQQARVDLLLGGTDPFSVAAGDVLLNVYQTQSGDPLTSGYTLVSKDITGLLASHAGDTLRLRFAEVDNQAILNLGVDDVRLAAVPEPSAVAWLVTGVMAGVALLPRKRRR